MMKIDLAFLMLVSAMPLAAQQSSGPAPSWRSVVPIDSGRLVLLHTDGGIITGRLAACFGISDPALGY